MLTDRELDALVAKTRGCNVQTRTYAQGTQSYDYCGCSPNYPHNRREEECDDMLQTPATEIADAWELHREVDRWPFSQRMRYVNALDVLLRPVEVPPGCVNPVRVAWPYALLKLTPRIISLAYVMAQNVEIPNA